MSWLRISLGLLALFIACSAVQADPAPGQPMQLLGDRLRIRMPEGSEILARPVNVMAAEVPTEEETRVVLDQGDKRLVLMAYEGFRTAGPTFLEELNKTEKHSLLVERDSFRVYQSEAEPVKVSEEAVRVTSAWVVNSDNTVQLVVAYANPAAAANMPEVQQLFGQALKTLEPGQKRLLTEARMQRLGIYSDSQEVVVQMPEGWVHTLQDGPDFLVHRLRKLVPFGTAGPTIGMYVGSHPGLFSQEGGKAQKSKGLFLGRPTDWFRWLDEDGSPAAESIRPVPEVDDHLQLHVFLSAPSENELQSVQQIVDTMALVEKAPGP